MANMPIQFRAGLVVFAALALLMPSCETGGHFTLLGYTSKPNYDEGIRTVHVPIFKNKTFIRGVEFDLTEAVIREIEAKTPFKVVGPNCSADTELTGTVVIFTKGLLNVNQLNEVREAETTLSVEVVWKDLRTGEYLTKPIRRPGEPAVELLPPSPLAVGNGPGQAPTIAVAPTPPRAPMAAPTVDATPGALPAPGDAPKPPPPVLIRSVASFIPELGESRTAALQKNVNSLAVQIVSMMELPW